VIVIDIELFDDIFGSLMWILLTLSIGDIRSIILIQIEFISFFFEKKRKDLPLQKLNEQVHLDRVIHRWIHPI